MKQYRGQDSLTNLIRQLYVCIIFLIGLIFSTVVHCTLLLQMVIHVAQHWLDIDHLFFKWHDRGYRLTAPPLSKIQLDGFCFYFFSLSVQS